MTRCLRVVTTSLALLLGCSSTNGVQPDSRECQPNYELGNPVCAVIEGRVVDADNKGLDRISVGARYPQDSGSGAVRIFTSSYAMTDSGGYFSLRIARIFGTSPPTGPDTVSVWVRAADPTSAGVGVVATRRDSALVQVKLSVVGEIPEAARVTLQLP